MTISNQYGAELTAQLGRAAKRGMKYTVINERDLDSSLGDFPSANDKTVSRRLAMRSEMNVADILLVSENNAAGMTVRYTLPRAEC